MPAPMPEPAPVIRMRLVGSLMVELRPGWGENSGRSRLAKLSQLRACTKVHCGRPRLCYALLAAYPLSRPMRTSFTPLLMLALFLPCATGAQSAWAGDQTPDWAVLAQSESTFGDDADLLTAGLGLSGLQASSPLPGNPGAPTAAELRRLAIHNAWTALAVPRPAGGLGEGGLYEELPAVAGDEISALLRLAGARHPFRVLVQIPNNLDTNRPCLFIAPASGSRGVYGAVPLAGPPALTRGCAIAYTDKGAGTDHHELDRDLSPDLAGLRRPAGDALRAFSHRATDAPQTGALAMKHAHSGDHPEADWGRHVLAAAGFARQQLRDRLPEQSEIRVIAVGLSNGAAAALRAAEIDSAGLLDAVVAVMPNITSAGQSPLYDYATLAALYQPCALGDAERTLAKPLGNPVLVAMGRQRCESLAAAGLLEAADPELARALLLEAGFEEPALALGAGNVALDLWRAVAGSYASAYLRRGPDDMPCGYALVAAEASEAQRAAWWATHSGVGPGGGIDLVDGLAEGADAALPGLVCLRELWIHDHDEAIALRAAVEQTRATARLPEIPVLLIHGREDGLIPAALSSRPYVQEARARGAARLAYWEVDRAQHFDAFLNVPGAGARLVPILPYGWAGIDHVLAVLSGAVELGEDRRFSPQPGDAALTRQRMGLDE
ncbi:MAG: hydrogenase [Wenzhouxiangella sp.]|nr:MAG: hydrogenase [Wenzhouxiangella sp.]